MSCQTRQKHGGAVAGERARDEVLHEVGQSVLRCFGEIDEGYDGLATSTGSPSTQLSLLVKRALLHINENKPE